MKIMIYTPTAINFERLKQTLAPHMPYGFYHVTEDQNSKFRLVPHAKACVLALVDCDQQQDGALTFASIMYGLTAAKRVPIIAMSGSSDAGFLKRLIDAGCTDFVVKPYEEINLITRLKKHLKDQMLVNPKGYLGGESATDSGLNAPTEADIEPLTAVPFAWQEAFELGVPDIDQDHKRILEHYHELYLNMREGRGQEDYQRHIEFLMKYVEEHFEREERLQVTSSYSEIERHKAMHQNFTLMVAQMIKEYQLRGVTNRDLIRLNLFIKDWLLRHILIEDRKLAKHLKK